MSASMKLIEVAAGCLINAAGEVLIAQRPQGKIAAGQWEFPGGKLEPGESPRAALDRELHEELGIEVVDARPLIRVTHAYSDRTVRLDCWKITRWRGEPQGREQQAFAWVRPEATDAYPILAADGPIISALRLPDDYVFTPPDADPARLRAGFAQLPRGALLRLRLPALDDGRYAAHAAELLPAVRAAGLRLILDRDPQLVADLGADGWHANGAALRAIETRPPLPLCLASCHDPEELRHAAALGFDAAVLGPLQETTTHPGQPGLGFARAAPWLQAANLPVYLIGGLARSALPQVQQHYAQGIAAISAYWRD